jgi:hypothetical protein
MRSKATWRNVGHAQLTRADSVRLKESTLRFRFSALSVRRRRGFTAAPSHSQHPSCGRAHDRQASRNASSAHPRPLQCPTRRATIQHMCHPAAGTPRPARTQLHRSIRAAHLPRPRPPPPRQHIAARRAPQLTCRQPALDSIKIGLYGDHCASKREQTALPPLRPKRQREGRRLPTT